MDANRHMAGGAVSTVPPRFCVPAPKHDPERTLAWVNSICAVFLIIGVTGARNAFVHMKPLPPIAEAAPVMVEPLTPPPQQTTQEQKQEPPETDKNEAPQVVAVSVDTPSVNFSVPTIGNVLVPSAMATAPPLHPLEAPAPLRTAPTMLDSTGRGGERPQPPYPQMALDQGEQGSVVLQMTVDEAGLITGIEVTQTSGHATLDRSALDYVKRHWIIPPGKGARVFEATITYKLRAD